MDKSTQRSVVEAIDRYIRVRYAKVFGVDAGAAGAGGAGMDAGAAGEGGGAGGVAVEGGGAGGVEPPMLSKAGTATFDEEVAKARNVIALLGRGEMLAHRYVLAKMELELGDNRRTVTATCEESYAVEYAVASTAAGAAAGKAADAQGKANGGDAAAAAEAAAATAEAGAGAEAEAEAEDDLLSDTSVGMRRHVFTVDLTIDGPLITAHEEQEVSAQVLAEQAEMLKALADATTTRVKPERVAPPTTFQQVMGTPKLQLLRLAFGGASLLHIAIIMVAAMLLLAGLAYTVVPTTTIAECSLQTGTIRTTTTLFGMRIATSQKDSPNSTWARVHVLQGTETWLPLTSTTRNNAGYMTITAGHPLAPFIRPNLKILQGLASREPERAKSEIERYLTLAADVDPKAQSVDGVPESIYATRPDPQTIRQMPPFAAFSFEKR